MAKIAMLLASEFEDVEYSVPRQRLEQAGHQVEVLGSAGTEAAHGKRGKETVGIDAAVRERDARSYDALVIPGGHSPDHLRIDPDMVRFVQEFAKTGRPLAAVCHGPQLLIEAQLVRDRMLTSWPSVRMDLKNAGAQWLDREVVEDGTLITSRKPDDLEAFSQAILRQLQAGKQPEPQAWA